MVTLCRIPGKMDAFVGPSLKYCAYLPGTDSTGNAESSNSSEEQSQSQWQTATTHSSAVKFKIRSAKERQTTLKPDKGLRVTRGEPEAEAIEKVSEARDQTPKVWPHSPPYPNTDAINARRFRDPNQFSITKCTELPFGPGTSNILKGPESFESPSSKQRGRTEWRERSLINRSKSLDWSGKRGEEEKGTHTTAIRNTKDFVGQSARCSESFEIKDTPNSTNSDELSGSLNSMSQSYSATEQGSQDRNRILPSVVSLPPRISQVSLALERTSGGQSLPFRLKPSMGSMEEENSPWNTGIRGSKPNQSQHCLWSQLGGSNVKEVTGNQTILERIGKLYGLTLTEDNGDDRNSRSSVRAKRNSAPVGDWIYSSDPSDAKSNHRKPNIASTFGSSSSSKVNQWKNASYDAEKSGTFPRIFSKVERINISSMPNTLVSSLPNRNDEEKALFNMSVSPGIPQFDERNYLTCLPMQKNERNKSSQSGGPLGLENHSLDAKRAPTNSVYCTTMEESRRKETEKNRQVEKTSNSLTHTKDGSQELHLFDKGVIGQTRPKLVKSVTVDGGTHIEDISEFGLLSIPMKKRGNLLEKFRAPSIDSVQSTIHKFEALAQQNNVYLHPRRAFSVPEKPKLLTGVNKSNSDKSLSGFMSDFSKSEVSEEVVGTLNLRGPSQVTGTEKVRSTMKNKGTAGYEEGHADDQMVKLWNIIPSDQNIKVKDSSKDEFKISMVKRNLDVPDFSRHSYSDVKNMDSTDDELRKDSRSEPNWNNDVSHFNLSERKCLLDSKDTTFTECPGRTHLKASLQNYNNSRTTEDKAFQSLEHTSVLPNSTVSTSVKSALLRAYSPHSKSPSIPLGTPETHQVKTIPESPADLNNSGNRITNEKIEMKISRWITDGDVVIDGDGDDDDIDDEGTERGYDSDSGESSITITSNTSQSDHKSFSLSFVDLCNLGGLDCPPSGGSGSKNEERWMCKRSASLSSDASILSCVTLLGTEELDCLLDDVRGLGNETLENYEDVHVVVLHKEVGNSLGFTVAGGVDQNKPITVHRVFLCGAAAQEGSIHEGDQVLSINGTALQNSAHWEALRTLRKARAQGMAVVVLRKGNIIEPQHNNKDSLLTPAGKPGSRVRVTLTKSIFDLGFSLEGGVGSSLGDKPLTVQKVFQGGPMGQVFPGDELIEIQGQSLEGLRRLEAWNLIKRLPPGPVDLVLYRPPQPQ